METLEKVSATTKAQMSAKQFAKKLVQAYNESENAKGKVSKTFAKEVIDNFKQDVKDIKIESLVNRAFTVADKADKRYKRTDKRMEAKDVYESVAWEFNIRDLKGKKEAYCVPCAADISADHPENGNTMYFWFEDGVCHVIFRQKPTFTIHRKLTNKVGLSKELFAYEGIATKDEILSVLPETFKAKVCKISK